MDTNLQKPTAEKRLYRSRHDRMLAGVAGGLAHYFGVTRRWCGSSWWPS